MFLPTRTSIESCEELLSEEMPLLLESQKKDKYSKNYWQNRRISAGDKSDKAA